MGGRATSDTFGLIASGLSTSLSPEQCQGWLPRGAWLGNGRIEISESKRRRGPVLGTVEIATEHDNATYGAVPYADSVGGGSCILDPGGRAVIGQRRKS